MRIKLEFLNYDQIYMLVFIIIILRAMIQAKSGIFVLQRNFINLVSNVHELQNKDTNDLIFKSSIFAYFNYKYEKYMIYDVHESSLKFKCHVKSPSTFEFLKISDIVFDEKKKKSCQVRDLFKSKIQKSDLANLTL